MVNYEAACVPTHVMQTYRYTGDIAPIILNLGGERSASRFIPWQIVPGTNHTAGFVGPISCLDILEHRKIL